MSAKRDKGPDNPWVRKTESDDAEAAAAAATAEPELPPSPWSLEVPPKPASPWSDPGPAGSGAVGTTGPGEGGPAAGGAPGGTGPAGATAGLGGAPAPGDTGVQAGSGPARETSSPWGEKVGPPSLRRPEPVKKKPVVPTLLIPIVAGIAVVALVAVALVLLTGGDDSADPTPTPTASVTTPPASTYTPPPNAIAVQFGVSVVPADGWSVVAKETVGKQLATYAPNSEARAFLWVRQKQNVTANAYVLGIIEGETQKDITALGAVRNLPCPKDVLVECVALSYTSTDKGIKIQGWAEAYRRKDGIVTALDFRTRSDYAQKAEADVVPMKQSVIDSL
ncbi:hypothetical protein [Kribbella sp. VKM Ac-2568]|uniref:hypothetical protein n=1 Tax=Kribbella sp. VKM Ac-2568 TaxID=2512219 RepID=UPI001044FA1B|nr:hypothetical protein [Kribbella sp. VKM Ac-2568]TCM50127.1 hypothetical protein EV648_102168 [Kribbella sp. VKM Ac-2568]